MAPLGMEPAPRAGAGGSRGPGLGGRDHGTGQQTAGLGQLAASTCFAAAMTAWQATTWADAPKTGVPLNAAASSSPLTLPASASRTLSSAVRAWLVWM